MRREGVQQQSLQNPTPVPLCIEERNVPPVGLKVFIIQLDKHDKLALAR